MPAGSAMPGSEEEPLLGREAPAPRNQRRQTSIDYEKARENHISKPNRTVIVEPLVALGAVAGVPFIQLYQEFVYQRFSDQLAKDRNISISGTTLDGTSACDSHNASSPDEALNDLIQASQAAAAQFLIYISVATAVPACIFAPFITAYSDHRGRRYAIIPPAVGLVCQSFIYLLTVLFELPLWILVVGSFIGGLSGEFGSLLSAGLTYISDTTPRSKRAFRVTVLLSVSMIPMIIFPLLFGYLVKAVGFLYPFLCVFLLHTVGLVYAIFLVPETVACRYPTRFWSLHNLEDILNVFTRHREPAGRRLHIWVLLFTCSLGYTLVTGIPQMTTLFQLNKPLCWDSVLVGIYLAVYMAVAGSGQVVGLRGLKCCLSELSICLLSSCAMAVVCVYMGLVQTSMMMFLAVLFSPLSGIVMPLTRSMLSGLVNPEEQGKLYAGITIFDRVGMFVGGVVFNLIYAKTLRITSGFVFFVLAGLASLNSLVFLVFAVYLKSTGADFPYLVVTRKLSVRDNIGKTSTSSASSDQ